MHLRTVFLILLLLLCSFFLAVNWEGVMAPVSVNLLYTEMQAPLGLILLLGPGLLILITLLYGFVQQAGLAMELRRVNKQLQEARDLAQRAERSRFIELKTEMERQIKALNEQNAARHSAITAKMTAIDEVLEKNTRVTIDSISASVGEVEDRLAQLVEMAKTKKIEVSDMQEEVKN